MRVGYVHRGDVRDGVCRYGRLLAAEARRRPDLEVVEVSLTTETEGGARGADVETALAALAGVDLVHLQYTGRLWRDENQTLSRLGDGLQHSGVPLVASLHDVYPYDPWIPFKASRLARLRKRLRRWRRRLQAPDPDTRALLDLLANVRRALVCSEYERTQLARLTRTRTLRVVPHFVEEREPLPPRATAKEALGLGGRPVLTLLGFIHRRKGHDLVVEAMPALPADVVVVFAGTVSPGNEPFLTALEGRATALGVTERLRITGYLDHAEQTRYLAATDLALCPFYFFAASGSLSTWISAHRPVLCHALPQIAEYRALEPDAFRTFQPYTADALAAAIRTALAAPGPENDPAIARLHQVLSLPRIFDRHLVVYRDVLGAHA